MKAYFSEDGKPKVDITVVGLDQRKVISASIDTGFDGALMLSLTDALAIGLKLFGVGRFELADGTVKDEYVFEGAVELEGKKTPIRIILTTAAESLLGTALLQEHRLIIDFAQREVDIVRVKDKS